MDPYKRNIIPTDLYLKRSTIEGKLVAVMAEGIKDRKLKIIKPITRALCKYEIVELISTDEKVNQLNQVNDVAYLGFVEVQKGGIVRKGDNVFINNKNIGHVLGYDETHMPNHLNLIVRMGKSLTGLDLNLNLKDKVEFKETLQ